VPHSVSRHAVVGQNQKVRPKGILAAWLEPEGWAQGNPAYQS
jgi:hypothetical protein